jgi:hypothetical protein
MGGVIDQSDDHHADNKKTPPTKQGTFTTKSAFTFRIHEFSLLQFMNEVKMELRDRIHISNLPASFSFSLCGGW